MFVTYFSYYFIIIFPNTIYSFYYVEGYVMLNSFINTFLNILFTLGCNIGTELTLYIPIVIQGEQVYLTYAMITAVSLISEK